MQVSKAYLALVKGEVPPTVGETVILLHHPLPPAGVSIWMEKECQQNDSLADG